MGVVKKYGLARTDTQANTPMNEEWKKKKKKREEWSHDYLNSNSHGIFHNIPFYHSYFNFPWTKIKKKPRNKKEIKTLLLTFIPSIPPIINTIFILCFIFSIVWNNPVSSFFVFWTFLENVHASILLFFNQTTHLSTFFLFNYINLLFEFWDEVILY